MIIIETSSNSKKVLNKISKTIINNKLSPCVHMSKMKSTYIWKNKIVEEKEYKLSIKTINKHKDAISKLIKDYHNYDVYELSVSKVSSLNKEYIEWLTKEVN